MDAHRKMGGEAVIPPHPCRKRPEVWDAFLYKARPAIGNGFAKFKHFRSLTTRYDRTARNCAAQMAIASIVIRLRLGSEGSAWLVTTRHPINR